MTQDAADKPPNYNTLQTAIHEMTGARMSILLIIGGTNGNGFSRKVEVSLLEDKATYKKVLLTVAEALQSVAKLLLSEAEEL